MKYRFTPPLECWAIIFLALTAGCGLGESGKHIAVVREFSGAFAVYEFPKRKDLEKFVEKVPTYDKLDQFGKPDTSAQRSYEQAERYGAYIKLTYVKKIDKFDLSTVNGQIIMTSSTIKKRGRPPDIVSKTYPESADQQFVTAGETLQINEDTKVMRSSTTQQETQTSESLRGNIPHDWKSDQY